MNPGGIARAILCWAVPGAWKDALLGDLEEESAARGQAWYWGQVLRSILPMVVSRLGSVNWQISLFAVAIAAAGQIAVLDLAWSTVLSAVPLKADVVRGSAYMTASLAITLLAASLAGSLIAVRGLALAIPAAVLFNVLGLAVMQGITPAWFPLVTILATVLGITAGSILRRGAL